ncbi:MAG: site-2 protease family protein [Acidobacteriota bacterium]|nr:site-2 protease family protein [Acidobacteriota bacterium]
MIENLDVVGLALWLVAFLLSSTCHEAAHALAAKVGGDETAYRAGQVTLNPLPHIVREPFGMVVVPLMSYVWAGWMIGWASAPYDPLWAERHPRRAALMALAGPAANFALAALAVTGLRIMLATGNAVTPERAGLDQLVLMASGAAAPVALARLLSILASLNVLLGVFNLVPLPPLDGAAAVEGLGGPLVRRGMDAIRRMPFAGLIGILVAWQVFAFAAPYLFRTLIVLVHGARL